MSFLEIDDIKIYFEEKGMGETIVFIHAGVSDSRLWDETFDYFSSNYRVIRYDLRGFGKSTISEKEFYHAHDLKRLLDSLKITQVHLVGCSIGGTIATDYTLKYPDFVKSLVLVNGIPSGHTDPSIIRNKLWKEIEKHFKEGNIKEVAKLETMIWLVGRTRRIEEVDPKKFQKAYEMNLIALKNEFETTPNNKWFEPKAISRLDDILVPIYFIIGELDEPIVVKASKELSEKFNIKRIIIENSAHLPSLENSEEFNSILEDILAKITSKEID